MAKLTTIMLCTMVVFPLGGCDWFLDRALNRPDDSLVLPPELPARLARPAFAVVDGPRVIVGMDDGAQCLGNAGGSFTAAGWTGTLSECPYAYSYAVALAAGTPAGEIALEEVTGPVLPLEEGEVPFRPFVSLRVTDQTGQSYRFESAAGF
ncbi:MAG: hypothetical protein AAGA08_14980 [Pseudomonadota bacterium]